MKSKGFFKKKSLGKCTTIELHAWLCGLIFKITAKEEGSEVSLTMPCVTLGPLCNSVATY